MLKNPFKRNSLVTKYQPLINQINSLETNLKTLTDSELRAKSFHLKNLKPLESFYQNLAAVYRYKHGETQLEFVWDGREHLEKYKSEWESAFNAWTTRFCTHELFLQAVLDLTVFLPENRHAALAENKMNHFILHHFEMRLHKSKGLVAMKVA